MKANLICIAMVLSLLPLGAWADAEECRGRLLNGFSCDSRHFQLSDDDLMDAEMATNAARKVMEMENCQVSSVKLQEPVCTDELGGPAIRICKVESDIGYFVVMKDYIDGVHVIFNRWD